MSSTSHPNGTPVIGEYVDAEWRDMFEWLEASASNPSSLLTPDGKLESEARARAEMSDARQDFAARSQE
jgi:hypothetical protein